MPSLFNPLTMYQADLVKDSLMKVVGWQQHPAEPIDSELCESESGLTFQSQHPVLTIDNLRSIAPDFSGWGYSEYDPNKQYQVGNRVEYSDQKYIATAPAKGKAPTDTNYWKPLDEFSEWLKQETGNGIVKAVQKFINEKVSERAAKGILSLKHLFSVPDVYETMADRNKYVGLEIWPVRAFGVLTSVPRIGLCFEENTTVELYLFHSSRKTPVETLTLEYTDAGKVKWFASDLKLPFLSDETGAGGLWVICYDASGKKPVNAYRGGEVKTRYAFIRPFEVEPAGGELWDLTQNKHTAYTYGLNMHIAIETDFTNFIIDQRVAFQDVIAKYVSTHLLRLMAFNPEARISHREQNFRRTEILYEIDGDSGSMKKSGLGWEAELAMRALHVNMDKIEAIAMTKKGKLKYRTI